MYGAKKIIYLNARRSKIYTTQRDRKAFWRESLRMLKNSLKLRANYAAIREIWQKKYGEYTSEEFWENKLSIGDSEK